MIKNQVEVIREITYHHGPNAYDDVHQQMIVDFYEAGWSLQRTAEEMSGKLPTGEEVSISKRGVRTVLENHNVPIRQSGWTR